MNKILIVTSEFPPGPGGIGNHAYNLAKNLAINNFNVEVVTDQYEIDNNNEEVFDNKQLFSIKRVGIKKIRLLMYLDRFLLVLKLMRNNQVIIASGKFPLWIVSFSTLYYRRKFIAIIHGTEVNFKSKVLRKSIELSLTKFDVIIAVSNFTKSLVDHLKLKKIVVINNGFDVNKFNLAIKGKLKGFPSLITVGSVTERKGQENVIKALPSLLETYPNLHYHIVGKPIDKDKLINISQELNVSHCITFYGIISDEEKNKLLKKSDIFVMLSENTKSGDIEGFGIALIEANNFGTPSIGSKNCGIEDAILNNKSGILIDNKNVSEFSNAVKKIMNNYKFFKSESIKWSDKFKWDVVIKKYIKAFKF